jgi:hypothetical protein
MSSILQTDYTHEAQDNLLFLWIPKVFFSLFFFFLFVSLLHLFLPPPYCNHKMFFFDLRHLHATMSFLNMLNMTNVSGPTDFSLMESVSLNTPSSSMTFFGGLLLSPATISCRDISTPITSIGSEAKGTGAYAQLWRHFQQSEWEQKNLKQELESLKYTLFSCTL